MVRIDKPGSEAFLEYEPVPGAKKLVLVCPGGGYRTISLREGSPIARAFSRVGWQAFVFEYTVKGDILGTIPFKELSWAVDVAKVEAAKMGLAEPPLVLCGFSAGAHLAATLGVHWNDANLFPDPVLRQRHRPDALILGYPVITGGAHRHSGSFMRLAGDNVDKKYFSVENHVSPETPPTFLWHTAADGSVPVQNTLLFAEALIDNKVPVEVHIYPFGIHGLSLATEDVDQPEEGRLADPHVAGWFGLAVEWLDVIFGKENS